MSTTVPPAMDVMNLLAELHRKKRWLDEVIEGLESAVDSPESRLIQAAEQAFGGAEAPHVDVASEAGEQLVRLAGEVPRRRRPQKEEEKPTKKGQSPSVSPPAA